MGESGANNYPCAQFRGTETAVREATVHTTLVETDAENGGVKSRAADSDAGERIMYVGQRTCRMIVPFESKDQ